MDSTSRISSARQKLTAPPPIPPHCTHIDLRSNYLGPDSIPLLGPALESTELEELYLGDNSLGPEFDPYEGILAWPCGMSLTTLDLSNTELTSCVFPYTGDEIVAPSLTALDISSNQISLPNLSLGFLPALVFLSISDNPLPPHPDTWLSSVLDAPALDVLDALYLDEDGEEDGGDGVAVCWSSSEGDGCENCGTSDVPLLIYCDACDDPLCLSCAGLTESTIPPGDFICPECLSHADDFQPDGDDRDGDDRDGDDRNV